MERRERSFSFLRPLQRLAGTKPKPETTSPPDTVSPGDTVDAVVSNCISDTVSNHITPNALFLPLSANYRKTLVKLSQNRRKTVSFGTKRGEKPRSPVRTENRKRDGPEKAHVPRVFRSQTH